MPGGVSGLADQGAVSTTAQAQGKLTANTVYTLATEAGFTTDQAHTMVGIAWDESGFRQNIVNSIGCVGLWQINPVHFKEQIFKDNGWNTTTLKEGHANALAAKAVFDMQGFNAWTTYKHGLSAMAKAYAKTADQPTDQATQITPNTGIFGALGDLGSLVAAVAKAGAWLSNSGNWVRIAYVVGGGVVIIGGLVMIMESTEAGKSAISTAKTVGKVAAL